MAEGNSYTLFIAVLVGLVALFFIYWFSTSRRAAAPVMMRENYANMEEDNNDLGGMDNLGNIDANGVNVNTSMPNVSQQEMNRFAHAQDYPPTTKKPMNSDLVGENMQAEYSKNPALQQLRQAACFPKEMLTPEELKPQDNSTLWAQVNPEGEGSLKGRSFLQAGHHIGINTVGQTMRNANLQLRSEPPNPQVLVSPWNQTTIEPDVNRKPLEIGGCS